MSSVSPAAPSATPAVVPNKTNDMSEYEVRLIQWEEWALTLEEHFHAQELYARNPGGLPMGHHR